MNKVLALVILGMGFAGAVITTSIPRLLFESPIGEETKRIAVTSTVVFLVLTIYALKLRRGLENKKE